MKICYLTQSVIPSAYADSIQSVRMCHGLAQAGHEVILISPAFRAFDGNNKDMYRYYGVGSNFTFVQIPWRPVGGRTYFQGWYAMRECRRHRPDLVYSRSVWEAMWAVKCGLPTIFETHMPVLGRVTSLFFPRFLNSARLLRIVVISESLGAYYRQRYAISPERIVLARDAADLAESKADQVAGNPLLVGYAGSLVEGRGLRLILGLASAFPDVEFRLLGGTPGQAAYWAQQGAHQNVRWQSAVPPSDIPCFLQQTHVLLAPYESRVFIGLGDFETTSWMSPMKLFEYMAAGRAIICSDLPVLREFMRDGENALLCPPGDLKAWEHALSRLQQDEGLRKRLGRQARRDVEENYTWKRRAELVLEGLDI